MEGYLYVASGQNFVRQAINSAKSLRKVDSSANITLITDQQISESVFNQIVVRPMTFSHIDKVKHMYAETPYDETFFVDVDTYFFENCRELFKLLGYFDLCMNVAPAESEVCLDAAPLTGYTPYNTGLIIFRKNSKVEDLFKEWLHIYQDRKKSGLCKKNNETDQASLAVSLLHSDARVYILPNIWNARIPYFIDLQGLVKMVHGWSMDYEKLRKRINCTKAQRSWDPFRMNCIYKKPLFTICKQFTIRLIQNIMRNRIFRIGISYLRSIINGMPFIKTRQHFPYVLNNLKLLGVGCEIGVKEGEYSAYLLSIWKGKKLYSIDPWSTYNKDGPYCDKSNVDQATHRAFFEKTRDKLSKFGNRSRIVRKISKEAVGDYEDDSLDFVYIDAKHDYVSVKQDIEMWFKKVKKGGFLGGHDYCDGVFLGTIFGVKTAVDEFARAHDCLPIITNEEPGNGINWFIFKNE